jgi:hypothetical protein
MLFVLIALVAPIFVLRFVVIFKTNAILSRVRNERTSKTGEKGVRLTWADLTAEELVAVLPGMKRVSFYRKIGLFLTLIATIIVLLGSLLAFAD